MVGKYIGGTYVIPVIGLIKLHDPHYFWSEQDGELVYDEVMESHGQVTIDFSGMHNLMFCALHCSIGKLVQELGIEEFNRRINIKVCTDHQMEKVKKTIAMVATGPTSKSELMKVRIEVNDSCY